MSLMLQGSSKQNDSLRLDYFADDLAVASSHSKTILPNQYAGQHQGSYIPTLGAQHSSKQQALINRQDHHHSMPQSNNTSPNQYKFDFLRDVGLKMSLVNVAGAGGTNTSTGDISMYRASSQANYNFTQQFQQHMMQHHQSNQLHQQNHSSSHQSPHQPHQQLVQLHRLVPQQPQYGRAQNVYGGDDLTAQHCGLSDPQGFSNFTLLNAVEGHSSIHVGKNFELSSYQYQQNGGHVHSQHPAMQFKQQLLDQQQQQQQAHHPVQIQNYHQNNNYQYHNRNGHSQGGNQLGYSSQGAGRVIGTVTGRVEDGGRNGANGKKFWNTHGKGRNSSYQANNGSKQVGKLQSAGFGYRKNYHNYYSHPASGGNHFYENITIQQQQHQQQAQPHHHHKQHHLHRNLVYVRGYDRGHGAVSSHDCTNGNQHHEAEQTEPTHSAPSSPPEGSSTVETTTNRSESVEKSGGNDPANTAEPKAKSDAQDALIHDGYREAESGPEKVKTYELHEERVYSSRKLCSVPRSSSSSSVVSIPSTESSVMSCNTSQHESALANGHDYESDSSHSSDYREGTFHYSKYNDTNESQGTRSSSSTSSGVSSSSTTYPPLKEFVPSAPSSLHASTAGLVGEFIVRSQSFHGSHQNLTAFGKGGSIARSDSPPIGSPKSIPRTVTGTQSVPVFGELFDSTNHCSSNPIQFIHSQSADNFGSSASLELALHSAATNSSSSSSLSASSVPPNDVQSMQSGHPKTRSQSGRTSPTNTNVHYRSNTSTVAGSSVLFSNATTKVQLPSGAGNGRKNIHAASLSGAYRPALLGEFHQATPADRFILRAHDVEMKVPPDVLTNGSVWDDLSTAIWERFAAAQQSEEKYIQKMELWRELYICIKKGFPKYSLYLVGSTISGFGADSSDVDMCLVSRSGPSCYDHRLEALFSLSLVKEYFMSMPSSSFSEFSLIQAKVPILRFQDSKNGIEVDLNFNNCVGIRNTHLLHCYAQMDWRVRPLVLMVKLWAQHHNINDAKNMTISSYSLVLMVIHFLQCGTSPPILPCLHAMYPEKFMKIIDIHNIEMIEHIEPYQTDNEDSLGELLLNFLEYYTKFDYERYAISVRTSSIMPIEECRLARSYKNDPHHWKHLCIEEPFDFTNTARSVFDGDVFEQIKSTFAASWRMLKENKKLNVLFGEPLFTPVTSTLSITS
uniref:PAP-associated domain-containing protein n=1 Tax=Anopheles stephensi TaxID=30069 RepID=A0A182YNB1_ANOST